MSTFLARISSSCTWISPCCPGNEEPRKINGPRRSKISPLVKLGKAVIDTLSSANYLEYSQLASPITIGRSKMGWSHML